MTGAYLQKKTPLSARLGLTAGFWFRLTAMVDSHTIAAVTVTADRRSVVFIFRSMTAVVNAVTRLLQAASRLIMTAVALFKKTYCCTIGVHVVAGVFKKILRVCSRANG